MRTWPWGLSTKGDLKSEVTKPLLKQEIRLQAPRTLVHLTKALPSGSEQGSEKLRL